MTVINNHKPISAESEEYLSDVEVNLKGNKLDFTYLNPYTKEERLVTLDLPIDNFIKDAGLVFDPEGQPPGRYLRLEFIADDIDPIYINANDIGRLYEAGDGIIIDENTISADIPALENLIKNLTDYYTIEEINNLLTVIENTTTVNLDEKADKFVREGKTYNLEDTHDAKISKTTEITDVHFVETEDEAIDYSMSNPTTLVFFEPPEDVINYSLTIPSQAIAEAGLDVLGYAWSPLRVKQAINALSFSGNYNDLTNKPVIPSLPLSVANGGLNRTTIAANQMLYATNSTTFNVVNTSAFGRSLLNATAGVTFPGLDADTIDGKHFSDIQNEVSGGDGVSITSSSFDPLTNTLILERSNGTTLEQVLPKVLAGDGVTITTDINDNIIVNVGDFELFVPVVSLDSVTEPKGHKIYLVSNGSNENNLYDEYIWIDDSWEHIGSLSVSTSDCYTKSESDDLLDKKADKFKLTEQEEFIINQEYSDLSYNKIIKAIKNNIYLSTMNYDLVTIWFKNNELPNSNDKDDLFKINFSTTRYIESVYTSVYAPGEYEPFYSQEGREWINLEDIQALNPNMSNETVYVSAGALTSDESSVSLMIKKDIKEYNLEDSHMELKEEKVDKSDLATVATSGNYDDLDNKPYIKNKADKFEKTIEEGLVPFDSNLIEQEFERLRQLGGRYTPTDPTTIIFESGEGIRFHFTPDAFKIVYLDTSNNEIHYDEISEVSDITKTEIKNILGDNIDFTINSIIFGSDFDANDFEMYIPIIQKNYNTEDVYNELKEDKADRLELHNVATSGDYNDLDNKPYIEGKADKFEKITGGLVPFDDKIIGQEFNYFMPSRGRTTSMEPTTIKFKSGEGIRFQYILSYNAGEDNLFKIEYLKQNGDPFSYTEQLNPNAVNKYGIRSNLGVDYIDFIIDSITFGSDFNKDDFEMRTVVTQKNYNTEDVYDELKEDKADKLELHNIAISGDYEDLDNKPLSLLADGGNADTVDNIHIVPLTQDEYDNLPTKDPNTLYPIIG